MIMTNNTIIYLIIVLIISIFFEITVLTQYSQQCSSFCMCDTWYSLKRASCVGRHLYNIDAGAPNNVQALDLSDNVVSFLNSFELKVFLNYIFLNYFIIKYKFY